MAETPLPPAPRWWQVWRLAGENDRLRSELAEARLHVKTLQRVLRNPESEPGEQIQGWSR